MPKPFDIADILVQRASLERAGLMKRARALAFDIRSCKSCRGNLFVHVSRGAGTYGETYMIECPDCLSNIVKALGEGR